MKGVPGFSLAGNLGVAGLCLFFFLTNVVLFDWEYNQIYPLHPLAGVAFAVFLSGAYRWIPGLVTGALLITWVVYLRMGGLPEISVAAWLASSGLILLQEAAAAALLRHRYGERAVALDEPWVLGVGLLVGGPIACCLTATAVALLVGLYGSDLGDVPQAWMSWWAGDALGVVLVGPVALVLLRRSEPLWRDRAVALAASTLSLLVLLLIVFNIVRQSEITRGEQARRAMAETIASHIRDNVLDVQQSLRIAARIVTSENFNLREFGSLGAALAPPDGELKGMAWAPVVRHADRAVFEQRVARELSRPDFSIVDAGDDGVARRAPERVAYLPIAGVWPMEKSAGLLGLDVSIEEEVRHEIDAVLLSGSFMVTRPNLFGTRRAGSARPDRLIMLLPVFGNDGTGESLRGIIGARFDIGSVIASSVERVDLRRLGLRVADDTGKTLFRSSAQSQLSGERASRMSVDMGGREWHIEVFAAPPVPFPGTPEQLSWIILSLVLMVCYASQFLILLLSGASYRWRRTLLDRDSELGRLKIRLRESESSLHTIVDSAPLCIMRIDGAGNLLQINAAALELIDAQGAADRVLGRPMQQFVAPEFSRVLADALERTRGMDQAEVALRWIGLGGGSRTALVRLMPWREPASNEPQCLCFSRDMSMEAYYRLDELQRSLAIARIMDAGPVDGMLEDILDYMGSIRQDVSMRLVCTFDETWRMAGAMHNVPALDRMLRKRSLAEGSLCIEDLGADKVTELPGIEQCVAAGIRGLRIDPVTSAAGEPLGWLAVTSHSPLPADPGLQRYVEATIELLRLALHHHLSLTRLEPARVAFEALATPLMLTRPNGMIAAVNAACESMLGYPAAALVGRMPAMLRPEDSDSEPYRELMTAIQRETSWSGVMWLRHANGFDFAVQAEVRTVQGAGGGSVWRLASFDGVVPATSVESKE